MSTVSRGIIYFCTVRAAFAHQCGKAFLCGPVPVPGFCAAFFPVDAGENPEGAAHNLYSQAANLYSQAADIYP